MSIPTSLVGLSVEPMEHRVDARWTMAYAAAIRDHSPVYLDTTRPEGVVAHPVFAVCPEWPVIVSSRDASEAAGVSPAEVLTSVHATHDTEIHRLIRPGDVLTTSLEFVGLVAKRPGAMSSIRLTTVDADGLPVATTTQNGIYLGCDVDGDDVPDPEPPAPLDVHRIGVPDVRTVEILAGDAHTYTECARIWNPIHTDRAVALASRLPDIILHGTANLAHGVSAVVDLRADGDPAIVRRIVGRFAAMVELPSTISVHAWPGLGLDDGSTAVPFEVLNEHGDPAVRDGIVVLGAALS